MKTPLSKSLICTILLLSVCTATGIILYTMASTHPTPQLTVVESNSDAAEPQETSKGSGLRNPRVSDSNPAHPKILLASLPAPDPVEIIHDILILKHGQVTMRDATVLLGDLKRLAHMALPVLEKLLESHEEATAILGIFLYLELDGPSTRALELATNHPSPLVRAEAQRWLYLQQMFDPWSGLLSAIGQTVKEEDEIKVLLGYLDHDPPYLELPAVMSMFGLGRSIQHYLLWLTAANQKIASLLFAEVLNESRTEIRREHLVDILHTRPPTGYNDFLKAVISNREASNNLRWKAVKKYAETIANKDDIAFLEELQSTEQSPDMQKAIPKAITKARELLSQSAEQFRQLQKQIVHMLSRSEGELDFQMLSKYIKLSMATPSITPDTETLRLVQLSLRQRDLKTHRQRELEADIAYLLWSNRPK